MDENPYRAPDTLDIPDASWTYNIPEGSRKKLKAVATYQKGLLICILINVGAFASLVQFGEPLPQRDFGDWRIIGEFLPNLAPLALVVLCIAAVISVVFVFLLALQLYSTAVAVLLGVLTIVPCVSIFVLLRLNAAATQALQSYGIRVGLLGADVSKI